MHIASKSNKIGFVPKFEKAENLVISYRPWVYFLIFLAAHGLLSYCHLPLEAKLGIGLFGLGLPFAIAWKTYIPSTRGKILYSSEFLPPIPFWVWVLVGAITLFARCYNLTGLFVWPHYDEGSYGFYALQIMRHGIDRLLYCGASVSPFYLWWVSLWFRALGPSLGSLWLSPLLFSLGLPPLVYFVGRLWNFSRSFSFLCSLLTASFFWFWFIGRFAMQVTLIPFAEICVLGGLAVLFRAGPPRPKIKTALFLGLSVGLVFYAIYYYWFAVALLVGLTLWVAFRRFPFLPVVFSLALAVVFTPFLLHILHNGLSLHVREIWALSGNSPSGDGITASFSYLSAIFWGLPLGDYTFQPIWGGFLNPIAGALFFLGFLEAVRNGSWVGRWLAGAFLFLLLPGLLSNNSETFRIAPDAILAVPLVALGMARLLPSKPKNSFAFLRLGLFLIPSLFLDFYHLAGPFHQVWADPDYWLKTAKSINSYRAYNILRERSSTEGPGLILSNFPAGLCDQTLDTADYAFNSALNPKLDPNRAQWAAILANVNDQPFLARRFGPGKNYWLSKDLHSQDGGWMLWVIPLRDDNRAVFLRWVKAERALDGFVDAYLQNFSFNSQDLSSKIRPSLEEIYGFFKGDPFLETCYWEKMADLSVKAGHPDDAVEDLTRAIQKGFPAAHLFYRRGVLQMALGKGEEAQKDFERAVKAPLDFTDSRNLLAVKLKPADGLITN